MLALIVGGVALRRARVLHGSVRSVHKAERRRRDARCGAGATRNPVVFWIVALGGVAGNTTVMVTSLLGQIRIFYVMARDRMLPPAVAKIHPRFRTPAMMTMITGGMVAVLAALLPLADLLDFVNIGTLSAFAIVCAGVLGAAHRAAAGAPRRFARHWFGSSRSAVQRRVCS